MGVMMYGCNDVWMKGSKDVMMDVMMYGCKDVRMQ